MKYKILPILGVFGFMTGCSTMEMNSSPVYSYHYSETVEVQNNEVARVDDNKGDHYFPQTREATGKKVFIFDPKATAWAAYDENGSRVKTGRASGGKDYCPDVGHPCKTVQGVFSVYSKKGEECKSSKFPVGEGGAPMPNCMHFYRGFAIHGSYDVPDYNASHGCIRVTPASAEWLNHHFVNIGTTVIVKSY